MHRPNILWISLEDTSPRFGCYGDRVARTPNLDRLAAEGCRYPRAFSTAGVCAPSRAAIITGMYQTAIGAHHMRTTHANRYTQGMPTPYDTLVPHYAKCFPEYLRQAGYYCSNNSKTDYQFAPPFTAWDECSDQAHWRKRRADQPFFSVFNPTVTHESGMWARAGEQIQTDPASLTLPPYLADTPASRLALARHYDNLERADQRVGELLRELAEDGLAERTIVIIWSDHGEGLPRAKRWPYDAGIRIPLIVRWPGQVAPGTVNERLVSLVDLAPTMLGLAGVPVPAHMHGQPFLTAQGEPPTREYIYAARDRHDEAYDMVRAVRDARYKYIRHFHPELPYLLWIPYSHKHAAIQDMWRLHREDRLTPAQRLLFQSTRPPEELYDTENDPWEQHNLAADPAHQATLVRLRGALDDWRRRYGDLGDLDETEMVRRWYPDGRQPRTLTPALAMISPETVALEQHNGGGSFSAPCLLQMHCATQGASIGFTLDPGPSPQWQLYHGPLRLTPGIHTVRVKAIRIGYAESDERVATFVIT